MKNPANIDLFAYWNERRGNRIAPERGDIEPNSIRHVLRQLLPGRGHRCPISIPARRHPPLRVVWPRAQERELFTLWGRPDQMTMRRLIDVVVHEKVGVVANATAHSADGAPLTINLELLLLPLLQRGPLDARVLGALVPTPVPFWFGARHIGPLELGMLRHIGPTIDKHPAPRLVPSEQGGQIQHAGQIRGGFVVYDGGRTD